MIVLLTDFGLEGPYTGQVKAALYRGAPGVPVIDLFSDLDPWNVDATAYLLAAYSADFPEGTVFLTVVDPGVGSDRLSAVIKADDRWYVGPHNGLFELVVRRASSVRWWDITRIPDHLSASFHGRDLFAPEAAKLANGQEPDGQLVDAATRRFPEMPDDLAQIVYVDRYGNGITGLRASMVDPKVVLEINSLKVNSARTFSDMPQGAAFWYANSNGLVEIAANQERANQAFGFEVGTCIELSRD